MLVQPPENSGQALSWPVCGSGVFTSLSAPTSARSIVAQQPKALSTCPISTALTRKNISAPLRVFICGLRQLGRHQSKHSLCPGFSMQFIILVPISLNLNFMVASQLGGTTQGHSIAGSPSQQQYAPDARAPAHSPSMHANAQRQVWLIYLHIQTPNYAFLGHLVRNKVMMSRCMLPVPRIAGTSKAIRAPKQLPRPQMLQSMYLLAVKGAMPWLYALDLTHTFIHVPHPLLSLMPQSFSIAHSQLHPHHLSQVPLAVLVWFLYQEPKHLPLSLGQLAQHAIPFQFHSFENRAP
jgi:hypothetical protein